jgi:hypothetical protein
VSKKITIDEDTHLVLRHMQENLRSVGVKAPSLGDCVKMMICHRRTGGWTELVENAKIAEIRRESTYVR